MLFKIISSNIRFDNPNDGKHIWKNRKHLLAQIINDFESDILGTQEGWKLQLKDLAASLKNLILIDQHRRWIAERMYPCIFINPDTVRILRSGDIWLSDTPSVPGSSFLGSAFPRLCTWIAGQFINTNRAFFFVNVHLDNLLAEIRARQIEVLVKEAKKNNYQNLPLILCGDFNESPFGEVRKIISSCFRNLYDPWFMLNKEEEASHHSFQESLNDDKRIDWIMVDKKIRCHDIHFDKTSQNNLYPSDHYPLKGTFSF